MSVFRPSTRVESPDGRAWEIYAYKVKLRRRKGSRAGRRRLRAISRLAELAVTGARALRSDEWTVEAITFGSRPESHAWTTTTEYKGQVLAQVEGNLARGDVPLRLAHGTYVG